MNGTYNSTIFGSPSPVALGRAKRSSIIKSELQSQFQRILNQTLCVFSPMKDIKHIRQDFHSATWVMPRGETWGYCGGGSNFFFPEIQPDLVEISSENTALFGLGSLVSLSMKLYPC